MVAEIEKRTPIFDYNLGDFVKALDGSVATAAGPEAIKHIVLKACSTVRGVYEIYADIENPDLDHKYGNDTRDVMIRQDLTEEVRISELKRAIREALIYDPWITDVTDIVVRRKSSDEAEADFTVHHIFGTTEFQGVTVGNG
jgi:hypothetical protein